MLSSTVHMKQMTLQRSLFVSIGIHSLLFGTAIAFAGYAGGALLGRHDTTISVALVGSDALAAGAARAADSIAQRHKAFKPVFAGDAGMPRPESRHAEENSVPAERAPTSAGEGNAVAPKADTAGNAESAGPGAGTQSGLGPTGPRAAIEAALDRAKIYPRLARERGIQGVVHVRFKLGPSGDVERAEIAKSSGYDILDSASLKTVYRASPMPYVNGWMEVSMPYVLK